MKHTFCLCSPRDTMQNSSSSGNKCKPSWFINPGGETGFLSLPLHMLFTPFWGERETESVPLGIECKMLDGRTPEVRRHAKFPWGESLAILCLHFSPHQSISAAAGVLGPSIELPPRVRHSPSPPPASKLENRRMSGCRKWKLEIT